MSRGARRKLKTQLIIRRESYTVTELAKLLGVHVRTVQLWRRCGMTEIEGTNRPALFMGDEIRRFLTERQSRKRHPLKAGEFFCTRCKRATVSDPADVSHEVRKVRVGRGGRQVLIRGKCSDCGCHLVRFSTERKLSCPQVDAKIKGQCETLRENGQPPSNTDIERKRVT